MLVLQSFPLKSLFPLSSEDTFEEPQYMLETDSLNPTQAFFLHALQSHHMALELIHCSMFYVLFCTTPLTFYGHN
jgi:hypothetical protein